MNFVRKPFIFCGLFFLLAAPSILAQDEMFKVFDQRKDQALAALKNFPKQDTARVNALVRVFTTAVFLKQQKQVKPWCDEALALSRKLHYTKGIVECYLFTGNLYRSSGDPTIAHAYFDSLLLITTDTKDSSLLERHAQAYRWKGMIYYSQENYYEGLNNFFEALKYYEADIGRVTAFLYTSISDIYLKLNNTDQAIIYATKNAVLSEKEFSPMYQAQAYLSLVDIYLRRQNLAEATHYLDKTMPFIPDSIETMINFGYYENRGRIQFLLKRYDSSFYYYQQAYKYAESGMHSKSISTALYYLSTNALKLGKKDSARKYAEENLLLTQKTNTRQGMVGALLSLAEYYRQAGNPAKAYDLLQHATNLKDSLLSETNIKQANTLAAVYETDKKQKEITQLQHEKKIQLKEADENSTLNKVFISTIIGLLIFGYMAYRTVKSEQKIASQQQEIQKQKIGELEKDKQLLTVDAMLKGQEEERSRIAKDLHDGLGGMLSGVKLSFVNMKENLILSAEDHLGFERSIEMLDNTISELRKVAHNLMPESLVRFGLDESLKDYCCSIETATGINVVYQQFGEERKLSSQAEITVYRIVQELVNNALKYAGCKQIIVQLTKSHIKTCITVEDNGKGFDVKILEQKKGAGFSNIKYRVNYFKGKLDISSEPGNGTSIDIELMA